MSGTNLIATQAALTGLAASSMAAASLTPLTLQTTSESYDFGSRSTSRYVLAGTAMSALSVVLAGCSEPRPAPIANESALPPNQSQCTPASTSSYCRSGGGVSVEHHVEVRAQQHHTDQLLFGIIAFCAVAGTVTGYFLGRRGGRKTAEKKAQQAAEVPPQPPAVPSNDTPKTDNK